MTLKLVLLKSGEDVITDLEEMTIKNQEGNEQVIGYFFNKPYTVKLNPKNPRDVTEDLSQFRMVLSPWMPLSAQSKIPVVADWVISIVDPVEKLAETYIDGVNSNDEHCERTESVDSSEQHSSDSD